MKKLLLLITLIFTTATFAQVEKPSEGTIYEVSFMPNFEGTTQFALSNGHFVRRTLDGDSATRWRAQFSYEDIDGVDDANMTLAVMYGKEKHHAGSDRLATYTGWQAGLGYADVGGEDSTTLVGGVFVGANYYIANNVYMGVEMNYNLSIGEEVTSLGPGTVTGMFTLGFKM